jgi:hypothetical protein
MRSLPQLTNQHIYASKMKKMKVKYATQIFSNRLASTLLVSKFSEWGGAADTTEVDTVTF